MEIYSLSSLNHAIKRALKNAFRNPVWIEAEISRVNQKNGHYYLELVEKKDNQLLARSSAAIWRNVSYVIRQKLKAAFDDLIQVGISVKLLVDVQFHILYGHNLIVRDIDPEFTLGKMVRDRQQILSRLKKESILRRNATQIMPPVLKNIAIISSESAAGYKDFMKQLTRNTFNYSFHSNLFPASMQGTNLKSEIIQQLRLIGTQGGWDCVCIVRGGGSRVDLAWFDDYEVAREIAHCPIPVITGIGHDIDQAVADIVAHTSVKTPTAAGEFIVQHNKKFESGVENIVFNIYQLCKNKIETHKRNLDNARQLLMTTITHRIEKERAQLNICESELKHITYRILDKHKHELDTIETILHSESPDRILEKGYALVAQDGKIIANSQFLNSEKQFFIKFHDAEISIN